VPAPVKRRRLRRGAISGALEGWLGPGELEGADLVRREMCRRLALELDTGQTPAHAIPRLANAMAALLDEIENGRPQGREIDVRALLQRVLNSGA
jgi:hypothetical protein